MLAALFLLTVCLSSPQLLTSAAGPSQRLPALEDDTTCTVPEDHWYQAEQHIDEILRWAQAWNGERTMHLLDLFSVSQSAAKVWRKFGKIAASYDVKSNPEQDITAQSGFFELMALGLQGLGFHTCAILVHILNKRA